MTSRDLHQQSSAETAAGRAGEARGVSSWSVERYRRFFLTSSAGMLRESAGGQILEVNPALVELLGYADASEIEGETAGALFADPERAASTRTQLLQEGEIESRDVQLARADGATLWAQHDAVLVPVPDTGQTEIFRTLIDVQSRREVERGLQEMAYHDELTGVPNRRLLEIRAEQTLALARRRETRAALIFLDLVDFKIVNDNLGHASGDELLRRVAQQVEAELRTADTLARMGGDEFAVLLSEVEDREAAMQTARRLLSQLARPVEIEGRTVSVEGRAGVAIHPEDGEDLSSLLRASDQALIRAKAGVAPVVSAVE